MCNPGRSDSKSFVVLDWAVIRRANETIVRENHSIPTGEREICPEMAHIGENGDNSPMLGEYSYEVARVLFESGEYGEYGDHLPKYSRNSNEMVKGPFESGENDEFGENGESSPKPSEKVK